jgi:histidyl-tRNA synthetase
MAPSEPTSHPFSAEDIAEWAALGPRFKGKPSTPEEIDKATARKKGTTALKRRLASQHPDWSEKKIEKELDRIVEEESAASSGGSSRPFYLDCVSGTRDFYPADKALQNWLFEHYKEAARLFGFQEYDAAILEHVELYERKAGEEITGQMYHFEADGAHVTLRPEMTPTLARLVLNKCNLQTGEVRLSLPLKWYSIPQCWRLETTQRGRKREHYQWNMDIVGVKDATAEVELLAAACCFFQRLNLTPTEVGIKVNSRAILEAILAQHGVVNAPAGAATANDGEEGSGGGDANLFAKACVIIDKLDKIGGAAVTELLGEIGVASDSASSILRALEADSLEALAEQLGHDCAAIHDVRRLLQLAEDYGFAEYLLFDASVVRGLAYYTGVVWEAFDRRGELRAIMGGGRYDRLLELYGGQKCQIPCVGFGFGDCVIMELLKECNKMPTLSFNLDYVVCAYNAELYGTAAKVAAALRRCGKSVDLMPEPKKKVANSFKHADLHGARRMVFVAPDEVARGVVRVKDLRTKDSNKEAIQVDVPLDDIASVDGLIAAAIQRNEGM